MELFSSISSQVLETVNISLWLLQKLSDPFWMITVHQVSDLNIIIGMKYPVAEPTSTMFLNKSEVWPKNIKKYLFSTHVYFQECSNSLIIIQSCKEIDRMLLSLYDIVTQKHSDFYWFVSMSVCSKWFASFTTVYFKVLMIEANGYISDLREPVLPNYVSGRSLQQLFCYVEAFVSFSAFTQRCISNCEFVGQFLLSPSLMTDGN